ncbi:MAG: acyltransferase family protein [Clostridia bacterium]|nr:acyltransferase family protein [Clostridia bacterium]
MPNTLTAEKPIAPAAAARDVRYDLLRITAACMVVFLHTAGSKWHTVPHTDFSWLSMHIYNSFCRSAVPLFFMLSGAFLLKKEIPLKKLWLRKILPLGIIYIVWSFFYAIDAVGWTSLFRTSPLTLIALSVKSHYHMWYIPTLAGLYILQPVLYAVIHFENGKFVRYYLRVFFVLQILRATVTLLCSDITVVQTAMSSLPMELTRYAGYMLLGYYLANIKPLRIKPRTALLGFCGTVILAAAIDTLFTYIRGDAKEMLYSYFSLPVFAEAVLLFTFAQSINPNRLASPKASAVVGTLSSLTFGVYLLHPFILDKLETHLHLHPMSFAPILSIPVIAIIATILSGAITFVMLKLPVVKRLWKL